MGDHQGCDRRVLFMAPVKGGPRMAVKVADYRMEAEMDALVDLIFQSYCEKAGSEGGGAEEGQHKPMKDVGKELKGVEGLRKVADWLGIDGYSNMELEPLAKA